MKTNEFLRSISLSKMLLLVPRPSSLRAAPTGACLVCPTRSRTPPNSLMTLVPEMALVRLSSTLESTFTTLSSKAERSFWRTSSAMAQTWTCLVMELTSPESLRARHSESPKRPIFSPSRSLMPLAKATSKCLEFSQDFVVFHVLTKSLSTALLSLLVWTTSPRTQRASIVPRAL
jgi:hypothetical protein